MNKIDETKCPLCGEVNLCGAVLQKAASKADTSEPHDKPCWCYSVKFPPQVLDTVPANAKNKACICQQCVIKLTLATALS